MCKNRGLLIILNRREDDNFEAGVSWISLLGWIEFSKPGTGWYSSL
jgi:hypothetical protein